MPERQQLLVQLLGNAANRSRGNVPSAHLLQDVTDITRGDALEIPLRTSHQQRSFTSLPLGEHRWVIRLTRPHLRHVQRQLAHPRVQLAGLETVAIPATLIGPLMRPGRHMRRNLCRHRLVDQMLQQPLRSVTIREYLLQQLSYRVTILLGHRLFSLIKSSNNLLIEINDGRFFSNLQKVGYTSRPSCDISERSQQDTNTPISHGPDSANLSFGISFAPWSLPQKENLYPSTHEAAEPCTFSPAEPVDYFTDVGSVFLSFVIT